MKKVSISIILGVLAILIVIIILIAYFYKGLFPVLGPVPANVNQLLPQADYNQNNNLNQSNSNQPPVALEKVQRGPYTILGDFQMDIFAQDLQTPRVLLFDDNSNLLVSAMGEGKVYAIKPDGNKVVLAQNLTNPHGLAIKEGYLYIAETKGVSRYQYDINNLKLGAEEHLFDLPVGGGHFTRTIKFGPNGYLYVSVGSSCNVCNENDERRATVLKYNPKDWSYEVWAKGLRNTVFFTLNPKTQQFWGNDMGRDLLGDNVPPDELNILQSGNYGWPICYGDKIHDSNFDKNVYIRDPCSDTIAPIYGYPAHNAPLGLTFIDSQMFPADWQGDLLVSLHGSWNRTVPDGYKVVHLKINGDQVVSSEDFITGFLTNSGAIGRPVDLVFGPDQSLYLSDDKAGVIYKIYK